MAKKVEELEKAIVEDYCVKGLSVKELCQKYRVSPPRIYYIFGKHGVTVRRGARGVAGMMARVQRGRLAIGRAVVERLGLKEGQRFTVTVVKEKPITLELAPAE